jgi:hypothetical protein
MACLDVVGRWAALHPIAIGQAQRPLINSIFVDHRQWPIVHGLLTIKQNSQLFNP